jgi:ribosomal protein S18 acetylase RimI-like enzyme
MPNVFKVAQVTNDSGLKIASRILERVYKENPAYWPHGLHVDGFDGGLFLVMEKKSNAPAGFVGWQEREERDSSHRHPVKVGYYSIGILPEYRNNGYAKAAVSKLISMKSASVDKVQALIVSSNAPSLALAHSLDVPVRIKQANIVLTGIPGLLMPLCERL